jgi:hypothetical protein
LKALCARWVESDPAVCAPLLEPEIHRADPKFGATLRLLQEFSVKLLGQREGWVAQL